MLKGINLKSELVKSVVLLTSGTILAQIISVLVQPLITRLYSPDEIGELGYFISWATFISSVATARYEMAIPLTKNSGHSFQVFRIALRIGAYTILSVLACGLIYALIDGYSKEISFFIIALSAASFGIVFRSIGTNWSIKMKAFKRISQSKIIEAIGMNGFRILAGLLNFGVPGLIISTVLGIFSSALLFILDFFKIRNQEGNVSNKGKQKVLLKEHNEFPKVNLPHIVLDTGKDVLIAVFIHDFFDPFVYGSYFQSLKMLKIPLAVVGASIGQVFFQRASEQYSNRENIYPLLRRTTLILTALSIIPFGLVFLFGEELFSFILGSEWGYSGIISAVIAPWLMINFITSPVSTIPIVINKQRTFFWLGLIGNLIQLLVFGLLPYLQVFKGDNLMYFQTAGILMSVFTLISLWLKLYLVKQADKNNAEA